MRAHGVPSFPDPGGSFSPGIKQNPAFGPAMQRCNKLLPISKSTSAGLPEAQRAILLAQAACIRTHGVPSFPDPTFPRGGGVSYPAVPGFDPGSPASQRAAAACGVKGHPHGG
jgi:hypothetical protein